MAFSGALTLTDLNDFINPSQACIKPVEQFNKPVAEPGAAATQIEVDAQGGYYEVAQGAVGSSGSRKKLETAQISLNDCLACSGCITSAESVLITLQSHEEVLNFLSTNPPYSAPGHRIPILSISPQSLASLSASLSPSPPISAHLHRISQLASQLGFFRTYDTTFARHIAHLEQAVEFSERAEAKRQGNGGEGAEERLPMLASACPGWVCYAEKTHGEMLPFMSRVKSPQQIMGTLVKEWLGSQWGASPEQIYHVTVMPCYDKKLEASRQDFYNEQYSTRDVDCVLTTGELALLLREKGFDLSQPAPSESFAADYEIPSFVPHPGSTSGSYLHSLIHSIVTSSSTKLVLETCAVRGSADYVEYTLKPAQTEEAGPSQPVFRAATCYGFRNLQNLVRKVARDAGVVTGKGALGRLPGATARRRLRPGATTTEGDNAYDFVEVMACPGGCVNGGGQMKPSDVVKSITDEEGFVRDWTNEGVQLDSPSPAPTPNGGASSRWGDKAWLRRTEEAYWTDETGLPTPPPSPDEGSPALPHWPTGSEKHRKADALAMRVLDELCHPVDKGDRAGWASRMDDAAERKRRNAFRTHYRAVESEVVGLAVKW
ncbi:iron hydrogenase [Dacryopinax primogenitus]|uniref:Cytosolic Fe-S cluster assembly factor NAR1 n=1 Tax=Dacryopinax primogenitus (strain DJM 731) TaxID=1858805 RepID=M5GFN5_DACPD|nr:iron hydrogenase [Dacryopinax primogenitus]EJU04268.1 iron hydrogenase [Dacryopinax primogenitus]